MKVIYSEDHRKRASKTELYGGELVPPFECPERMDYILNRLKETEFGEITAPHDVQSDGRHLPSAAAMTTLSTVVGPQT